MKSAIKSIVIFFFFSNVCIGQPHYDLNQLLQGIEQDEFSFMNGQGYSILCYDTKKKYSTKTIKKLKKKFKIPKKITGTGSSNYSLQNIQFEQSNQEDGISYFTKHIIYPLDNKHTRFIELMTNLDRDTLFENEVVNNIMNATISREVFNNWKVDSIRFINRHITLGSACTWQNVGSIQCPYNGQMDWMSFTTEHRAREYMMQRINNTSDKKMSDFIAQDSVQVFIANKEKMAQKNILKIKAPKLVLGGSNELTIYYLITKIESVYVAMVMSHYSNDNNAPELPPLLSEVMRLSKE